jgi:hypothetical protein
VLDVVLNPGVAEMAESAPEVMAFTAQLIAGYLLEKHKLAVADEGNLGRTQRPGG